MASIIDTSNVKLIAFATGDSGKSLFPSVARDVLASAPSGSFVDMTDEVLAISPDFLTLAALPKLTKDQKNERTRVNAALARAVKRDDDTRSVSGFRFTADDKGNAAGYGVLIA